MAKMESDSWAADAISCLPLCEAVYSESRPAIPMVEGTFSCSICNQPFTDMTEFICHVQNHTEEKSSEDHEVEDESKELPKQDNNLAISTKFTCAICLMSFPSDFSLINHVARHSIDETPTPNSNKELMNSQQNIEPVVSNGDSTLSLEDLLLFTCAICNKSLSSDKDLALHVKGHSLECDIKVTVGVPRPHETLDIRHTVTRSIVKPAASMQSTSSVLAHSNKRKKIFDLLSFQCTICNKYFKNAVTLKSHKKLHALGVEPTTLPLVELPSSPDVDKMTEVVTTKVEPVVRKRGKVPDEVVSTFKCAICSKLFTNEGALIVHVSQHASAKQHECATCHKTFKCQSHLSRHERIHLGVRPFGCPVCPSAFSRRSHLSTHLRLHRGERPFTCTTCDKTFTDGSNLAKHLRLHVQEKSHRCETCDRVFGRSDTLAKHRRSHSGAKPYQCQLCARLFPRQDSLARHLKSHRGEKPHQCIVCSKAFTQKYDLTLHYRTHARNFTLPGGWGLDSLSVPELPLPGSQ